jgi:Leucine-rich repeat (LRR) protein
VAYVFFALLFAEVSRTTAAATSDAAAAALRHFYDVTGGASWSKFSGWRQQTPDFCQWYGIRCGDDGNVSGIMLRSNNLNGTLPSNETFWKALANVRNFDVSMNRLTGTIPVALASGCPFMKFLNMSGNKLSGTLPLSVSALSSMEEFDVSSNAITGTLPSGYGNLTNIQDFVVSDNRLTGTLPAVYSQWVNLQWFRAASNNLGGTLPPSYKAWIKLQWFRVELNKGISGTLPSEYGSWLNLLTLNVNGLSLHGTLPSSYGSVTSLQRFSVYDNDLSGTLPESYSNWSDIVAFQLLNNGFSGTLPSSYGVAFRKVSIIIITNTSISGTIPDSWGNMKTLTTLMLHVNRLSGTLPASLGGLSKLTTLSLADNMFSGTVPFAAWSQLRNVQLCLLQDNPSLRGTVSADFGRSFVLLGLLAVCHTHVCGPAIPSLILGYGCMPQYVLRNNTLTSDNGITVISPLAKFAPTVPCSIFSPTMWTVSQSASIALALDGHGTSELSRHMEHASTAAPFFTLAGAIAGGRGGNIADLQILSGVMQSSCMCGSVSTTSAMKFTTSPFAGLGVGAVIAGNAGLTIVLTVVHWAVVRIASGSRRFVDYAERNNKTSRKKHSGARSAQTAAAADRPRVSEAHLGRFLPLSVKAMRRVESLLRFPNFCLQVALLLLPGVLVSSATILFTYSADKTTPGDTVAAVFGMVYTAAVVAAMEVLVFQRHVLKIPLRFTPIDFAALLPKFFGQLSTRKRFAGMLFSRGCWEPKLHSNRIGCIVSGLRGGCEPLWRCMPALNLAVQLLSAIPAEGSAGCGVIQLLTALLTASLGVLYAIQQPTRVRLASFTSAATLCLTSCLTVSGMLCREGVISETAVLSIGLMVSIFGIVSSVYSVMVRVAESWLMHQGKQKRFGADSDVCATNNSQQSMSKPYSTTIVLGGGAEGVGDGPPISVSPGSGTPSAHQNASFSTVLNSGLPPTPCGSNTAHQSAMPLARPVTIIYDTHYERLEELILQICRRNW